MLKAIVSCVQAGLRSELEIATDEMERAQQRLATLEREKDILLQGTSSPTAAQAANKAPQNKLVEESLRAELQNQVLAALFHAVHATNFSFEQSQEMSASKPVSWKSRCPFQSANEDAGANKDMDQLAEPAFVYHFQCHLGSKPMEEDSRWKMQNLVPSANYETTDLL